MGQTASATIVQEEPQAATTRRSAASRRTAESAMASLSLDAKARHQQPPARAALALSNVAAYDEAFCADPKNLLASTLLSKQDIFAAITKRSVPVADQMVFNTAISHEIGPITNQRSSGRCWLFSATNMLRISYARKFDLPEFQLSQSYLFFYDSLSKANYLLESMLDLAHEPIDSRIVQHLLTNAENDGGQFSMLQGLVATFGLVPQSIYPESFNSSNSGKIDALITMKLREYTLELRELFDETLSALASSDKTHAEKRAIAKQSARRRKEECLSEVYRMLAIACGPPPKADEPFTWEYYDSKGKYHKLTTTPLDFYKKHSPLQIDDYVSLVNDPRNEYAKSYTVDRLGSVWGAKEVLYLNAPSSVLKQAVVDMIKNDHPVWFGCDVGASSSSALGLMDADLLDFEGAFGITSGMSKAEGLKTGNSSMTHAMLITAVHVSPETGSPVRYRIENSWGPEAGPNKGYFIMSDSWFDKFTYQVVVPRKFVPAKYLAALDKKPVVLPVWDPLGALA